jgi:hypothetical protein
MYYVPLFDKERKVPQPLHQLRRMKRPTLVMKKEMKKALHRFASLLCLITLLLNASTCLYAAQPKQSSCSHCPKPAPQSHTLPSCCAAQQQAPAITSTEVKPPVLSIALLTPSLHNEVISLSSSPVTQLTASPPSPPRLTLRI